MSDLATGRSGLLGPILGVTALALSVALLIVLAPVALLLVVLLTVDLA